jgi:rSAM/selenodomain-associated transferase 2
MEDCPVFGRRNESEGGVRVGVTTHSRHVQVAVHERVDVRHADSLPHLPKSCQEKLECGQSLLAAMCSRLSWAETVLATTDVTAPEWGDLPGARVWAQGRGTLGDRLERILQRALRNWPAAIAIGTDLPGLPPALLDSARQTLQTADGVLGPTEDGGFYLLGLRRCPPSLLADLPWSTSDTFTETLERLRARGIETAVIAPWFDVDEPKNVTRLREMLEKGGLQAPATALALGVRRSSAESRGPKVSSRISIVIPVLNEEGQISAQLEALKGLAGVHEVIVVDDGSQDRTRDLVLADASCRLIVGERGRGQQMNAGARASTGDVLLFLHADVRLPPDAASVITEAFTNPRVVAGAFRTHTVADGRPRWTALWLRIADLRSRYTGIPYGDQALFVRRDAFDHAGGFPSQPLFEDIELSRRLRTLGRIQTVRASVRVSGRRFLARPLYYAFMMNPAPSAVQGGHPPVHIAASVSTRSMR